MKETDKFDEVISGALEKAPEFDLSQGFADRVINMVQHKRIQREMRRDRWWLVLGIVSMMPFLVYAFVTVDFKAGVGVFTFLSGYSGLIIFAVLFVTALHVIDRRLLKKQESG